MILKRKIIIFLVVVCCLGCIIGHCEKVLFDGKVGKVKNTSLITDPDNAKNFIGKWKNTEKRSQITYTPEDLDWSKYNALSFKIYSANIKSQIIIICDSNIGDCKGNYYYKKLPVSWVGWKTIVIPFKKFSRSRKPVGWNHINCFKLYNYGWGLKPVKGSKYYIDDIKLITVKEK